MQVSSTWKLAGDVGCEMVKEETTSPALLQIGISTAIPYDFGGNIFSHWIGTTEENTTDFKLIA
ncbi:hypothetical protein PENSUB_12630 [Penicillium subrubescens]|uniref:Uncharacterized protein n=1 Tax=Penicillium subrubescens TaxID=1316194 RepID=A0A1Q5SXR2_9EURO|nr:hypothetical protein PENSUB_12630 [Penicillium subrubescens]